MNPQELQAWIVLVGVMVSVGTRSIESIRQIFGAAGLTEEQQNAILDDLMDENRRRRAISAAIAGLDAPIPQADGDSRPL